MDVEIYLPTLPVSRPRKAKAAQVVIPGEIISAEPGFMRGHGTYVDEDGNLISSVAGVVERVNKLVSVRALKSRYTGDVGDVVVGRVTEVGQSRWRVDVNGRQDAVLQLGAVNLPGGAARRRTLEDQLQMRTIFVEHDVIVADVQSFFADGSMALQVTRSHGKLENDAILGINGYIWLSPTMSDEEKDLMLARGSDYQYKPVTTETRERLARVHNVINALVKKFLPISPDTIIEAYKQSIKYTPKDLLKPDVVDQITKTVQMMMF